MPLKELDKAAWSWAEITDPTEITNDHIFTAYRIKNNPCKSKSCRRNCRGNPFCLTGLGEARLKENVNNSSEDPNSEFGLQRREKGNFVGLKNLGATCYVNSLLQLWFHSKVFRDAILSWNPQEDPMECENTTIYSDGPFLPQSPVGHLQQLFALMFYSKRRYIDPSPLIESLRLDTSTQQDAQEFSKLLVSLIESTLKDQSLHHVKNFIADNFRGQHTYVTRCCKCHTESESLSMFDELVLNIKGNRTLTECLAEFLKEEKLEGTNCYSCTVCQSKEEAHRFIKLCSLPPILNLQLLRFVYDREKGQKKKLKSVVQFPETLDMKDFVESNEEKTMLYNLSAVLIHRGPRATSGHFIAYIKNEVSGAWYMFNDESVQKLEGKKLHIDEEDQEYPKEQKTPRLPKGFQSSTDAYMLVYTSENHKPSSNEVQLSDKLQDYVDTENKAFVEICEEIISGKKQDIERQKQILEEYEALSAYGNLNGTEVLSTDWLSSWLENKTNIEKEIDNSKLKCPHDKLDPWSITHAKYVSGAAADALFNKYGGGPRLRMSNAICEICVRNKGLFLRTSAQTLEESKEMTNLLKKRMGLYEPGFYVDKKCLKTWRSRVLNMLEGRKSSSKSSPTMNEDTSETLVEETVHSPQTLSGVPSKPKSQKNNMCQIRECSVMVRQNRNILLRRRNPSVVVPLSKIRDCVVLCNRLEVGLDNPNGKVKLYKQLKVKLKNLTVSPRKSRLTKHLGGNLNEVRKMNGNIDELESGHASTVKTKLDCKDNSDNVGIGNFSEKIEKYEEEESKSDDGEDLSKAFNEEATCPHGNLSIEENERKLVPVRVWEILKKYFPSAISLPHDTQPCLQCQNLANKDGVVKQQLCEIAQSQKRLLSDLFSVRNRPIPGKTGENIYILHKEHFHQPWSDFIKSSTRRDGLAVLDPPATLSTGQLLCHHGLLHYSPQYAEDLSRLVLATRQEWETLINFYVADHEVFIAPDLSTSPEVCVSCFSARLEDEQKEKLSYARAKLHIRLVPSFTASASEDSDLFDSETQQYKRPRLDGSTSPVPAEYKKVMKSMANGPTFGDVRRSARTRKVPGQKSVQLTVSSSLTLRELKQMITGHFAVAPFDQHLSTQEGRELEGDYNTLFDLGILPGSTLLLQVDEPKDNFDDAIEESVAFREPEAGFKGTGLHHPF